jgi:hypothetical protein
MAPAGRTACNDPSWFRAVMSRAVLRASSPSSHCGMSMPFVLCQTFFLSCFPSPSPRRMGWSVKAHRAWTPGIIAPRPPQKAGQRRRALGRILEPELSRRGGVQGRCQSAAKCPGGWTEAGYWLCGLRAHLRAGPKDSKQLHTLPRPGITACRTAKPIPSSIADDIPF